MNISVIITVYNRTAFLREAIQSVLVQNPKPEVLVLDDGSDAEKSDEIKQIVDDFAEVRLIRNPENRGVSFARNLGIKYAAGDWVLFLDDDDILYTDYFGKISEMNIQSDMVFTKAELIGERNSVRFQRLQKFYNFNRDSFHSRADHPLLFLAYVPAIHGILFRKSLFNQFQFPVSLTYGEDRALLLQMKQAGVKIDSNDLLSCGYRIHTQDHSKNSPSDYFEFLKQSHLLRTNSQRCFLSFQKGYFSLKDGHYVSAVFHLLRSLASREVIFYMLDLTRALIRK